MDYSGSSISRSFRWICAIRICVGRAIWIGAWVLGLLYGFVFDGFVSDGLVAVGLVSDGFVVVVGF